MQPRDPKEKGPGIVATPNTASEYKNRAVFAKEYHDANSIAQSDQASSAVDILEDSKKAFSAGFGRVIDRVILDSLVSTSLDNKGAKEDGGVITAAVDLDKTYKLNAFAKVQGLAANATLSGLDADDVEGILRILGRRDVEGTICAALTPEVAYALRTSADFKSRENIFSSHMAGDADNKPKSFEWKGIHWIKCSNNVLPELSNDNILRGGRLDVRDLNTASDSTAYDVLTKPANKAAYKTAVGGSQTAEVTPDKRQLLYVWVKEAMAFTTRPEASFARMSERDEHSYATQCYMTLSLGASILSTQYSVITAIGGTVNSALA